MFAGYFIGIIMWHKLKANIKVNNHMFGVIDNICKSNGGSYATRIKMCRYGSYVLEDEYIRTVSTHFYTGGIGAAIGFTDIVNNTKHVIVDFNVGFQFMPHNYADEITGEHGEKYEHNPL